jgi:hypothetical protein
MASFSIYPFIPERGEGNDLPLILSFSLRQRRDLFYPLHLQGERGGVRGQSVLP